MKVAELLERYPELTADAEVVQWLSGVKRRWIGYVRTTRHDGRGWWVLDTRAGPVPDALRVGAVERDGKLLVPLTEAGGADPARAALGAPGHRCRALRIDRRVR